MIEILFVAVIIASLGFFLATEPRGDYWTGGALIAIGAALAVVVLVTWWGAAVGRY